MEDNGYNVNFLDEVPDYLKCVGCGFVLRKPMLSTRCGHRFCQYCLEKMISYADNLCSPVICPVDQVQIFPKEMREDTIYGEIIGDLGVSCNNIKRGCVWKGSLNILEAHLECCPFGSASSSQEATLVDEFNNLAIKFNLLEKIVSEKNKETAFQIKELKLDSHKKNVEIEALKEKIKILTHEKNEEIFELKRELDSLAGERNEEIETIKRESALLVEEFKEETKREVADLKLEIDKSRVAREEDTLALKADIQKYSNVVCALDDEIKQANVNMDGIGDKVVGMETKIDAIDTELVSNVKELRNFREIYEDFVDDKNREVDILFKRLMKDEFLSCEVKEMKPEKTVCEFKLGNYAHHFTTGERIYSPKFYTHSGRRFQLFIEWTGKEKRHLGVYLQLCRGTKRSRHTFTFRSRNSGGIEHVIEYEGGSNRQYTSESHIGVKGDVIGFVNFLSLPELGNYITNNEFIVSCIFENFEEES